MLWNFDVIRFGAGMCGVPQTETASVTAPYVLGLANERAFGAAFALIFHANV